MLPLIGQSSGRVIDTAGDGIMAEFGSVLAALKCALAIQATMGERNADVPQAKKLQYRIGINLGDVIFDEARIYGDGINVAARLEGLAEPGSICVSDKVHAEGHGKVECTFEDLGEQALKNIARPVRVYRVRSRVPATSRTEPGMLTLPDKPSIAVLPFTNMSGDPEQEYFSDGIAEDILTELSRLRWLFVTARNSSFTYKGKAVDVKQVSRELGVRYVLEGSVRKAGNRVRVTGQLIDAATGNHVWAERYDRYLSDIFAVQDEITSAVAIAIEPAIANAEQLRAIRKPPESLSAWEAYHRGMWHLSKHDLKELILAREFFQLSANLDPTFASPLGSLGLTHTIGAFVFDEASFLDACKTAEPLIRKAVSLDRNDAESRARLAHITLLKGDIEGALRESNNALDLNPNNAMALGNKGAALIFSGRGKEGRDTIAQFISISPRDPYRPMRIMQCALSHYVERDYGACATIARELVQEYPGSWFGYALLAASEAQLNHHAVAKQTLLELEEFGSQQLLRWARERRPFVRPEYHEHVLEGLRKAGWQG